MDVVKADFEISQEFHELRAQLAKEKRKVEIALEALEEISEKYLKTDLSNAARNSYIVNRLSTEALAQCKAIADEK